jgi:hypothetical protein
MKYILGLSFALILCSCATPMTPREPSEYLLTTDMASTILLKDVKAKLEENKYKIRKFDIGAGLLLTEPRKFSFEKNGKKIAANQSLQLRQEGGSVKLRIAYSCNYTGDTFVTCHAQDQEAAAKINRVEPALVEMIRPLLVKHAASAEAAAPEDSSFEDWGAEAKDAPKK